MDIQVIESFDETFDAYSLIELLQSRNYQHVSVPLRLQEEGYCECLIHNFGDNESIFAYFNEEEHEMRFERIDKYGRIVEQYIMV